MFTSSIRLPLRLFGIPIHLDISFLIILPILGWLIATNIEATAASLGLDGRDPGLVRHAFALGLIAATGLFASVLVHEFGHSIVARWYGVGVKRITLWLLGGLAQLDEIPRRKGVEAVIAIAGPLTSYAVAGVFLVARWGAEGAPVSVQFPLTYLAAANAILATFNLIPAFPLDGGRVLRSLLALRLSFLEATQIAAQLGRALAIFVGIVGFLTFNIFSILIAFFVYIAGRNEAAAISIQEALSELTVADIMTHDVDTVPAHRSVDELLLQMMNEHHQGYPVVDLEGALVGIVSLDEVKQARRVRSSVKGLRISDVMRSPAPVLSPEDPSSSAFERLQQERVDRFPVIDRNGQMVGIVSRTDLLRTIQVKLLGLPTTDF